MAFKPVALTLLLALILGIGITHWLMPRWQTAVSLNARLHDKQSLGRDEQKKLRWLKQLTAQLKASPTRLRELTSAESPAVAALAMAQEVMKQAKSLSSDPSLPKPLRQCEALSMVSRGNSFIHASPPEPGWPSVALRRYQYDLALRGPYPALSAFVNRLALAPQLIGVDRIDIQRLPLGRRALPDILSRPDYPVPLEMVVGMSFYVVDPTVSPPRRR